MFTLLYVSDLKTITFLNSWFAIFIFLLLLQAEETTRDLAILLHIGILLWNDNVGIVMTHLSQGSLSFLITLLSHWLTLHSFALTKLHIPSTIKTQLNLVLFVFWENWAIRSLSILFEVEIGQSIHINCVCQSMNSVFIVCTWDM